MKTYDLDELRPKPVRVRYRGKEYDVRRDISTEKAVDLYDLIHQFDTMGSDASWDKQKELISRLPREAAALMTDDPDRRGELERQLEPDIAAFVIGLALGRDFGGKEPTPPKAAKGKKRAET